MTLIDTGPLVALFDPQDDAHGSCVEVLKSIEGLIYSTLPVLTEAFHILTPDSPGAHALMDFVAEDALIMWHPDAQAIIREFELMRSYSDTSMDLADASLVVAAETLKTKRVFTIDRRDFSVYRVKLGHRHYPFEVLGLN